MVLLTLVLVYIQPKIVSYLPDLLYSKTNQVEDKPLEEGVIDPSFFMQTN